MAKYLHTGEDCQKPQFESEMHYPGEMHIGMTHGSTHRIAQSARAHHHTHAKDRLIEHTMRTERNDYVGSSVNVVEAPGIIGNNPKHGMNFKFPEGKNPVKHVKAQPHKMRPKGEHKGGL